MPGTKGNSGGSRKGAGSPRRNLHIDKDTARLLLWLTKDRRALTNNPSLLEEDIIRDLVQSEWSKFDEMYERDAEIALEGEEESLSNTRKEHKDATRVD